MVSIEDLKLPPHNTEAEKAVISSVFLDNEVLFVFEGLALLPDDFYVKEHQLIREAIVELWSSRRTIDVLTIGDILVKHQNFEIVGGNDYLFELSNFLVSTSGSFDYAKIVKEKSILRKILRTSQSIIGDVYEQRDTLEILDTVQKRIYDLSQISTTDSTMHIREILNQRVEAYMDIVDNPEKHLLSKVMTTYNNFDNVLSGFKPGELIILAARPSMGKTAFALNLAGNVALRGKKTVAIFSLEMGSEQIVDRLLSLVAEVPMTKITKGQLDSDDFAKLGGAMETLGDASIFIDDKAGVTIPQLKSKLRRLKIEKGSLDLVIIDYLQLMNGAGSKFAGNRVQEISEISRGLKELARELAVPIIALSQLSRGVEQRIDKRPGLSDLRESGSIEQDADAVIMLYREDYYDQDTDRKGTADVLIRKNRNGPTADIEFVFQKTSMRFVESDKDIGHGE